MLLARIGTLILAGAILFVALRFHKASGKWKIVGCVIGFFAGCALLVTVVGDWMGAFAARLGNASAGAIIVCLGIIAVDVAIDRRPDKPAFWAAFLLPVAIVFSMPQVPSAVDHVVGGGMSQVEASLNSSGW